MKNLWLVLLFLILGCTQENSTSDNIASNSTQQWQGVYHGVFPCPSCEGMDTTLELTAPNKYTINTIRLGSDSHPYRGQGTFEWDKTGNIIILDRGHIYQVFSDHLYLLDVEFNRIKGPDAERYRVDKINGIGTNNVH